MTQHGAYSMVLYISKGKQPQLTALLQEIVDNDVETNGIVPFKQITSIHFARFIVLDKSIDVHGKEVGPRLVFTTNYDMPLNKHVQEMVRIAGAGLWRILSMCQNFSSGDYNADILERFLLSQNIPSETFYVGVGYRSVQQIHNENLLRKAINEFAYSQQLHLKKEPALATRQRIIDFVHSRPDLRWAETPEPGPSKGMNYSYYGTLFLVIGLLVIFSPIVIAVAVVWMLIMLVFELTEKQAPNPVTKDQIRTLIARETQMVQAQFSALGNIKPGWFRLITMRFLLRSTDFLAPYIFTKGKLSGIPTVHFARWLLVNEGKQMLFLSNYDGNSENYLRDFINIAAKQLTLLFCLAQGYPKTWFMVFGGAKDAENFMAWARYRQVITNVWYSANKEVSVMNIFQNSKIRNGICGTMTETEAQQWISIL
jgi:hypothetical protein